MITTEDVLKDVSDGEEDADDGGSEDVSSKDGVAIAEDRGYEVGREGGEGDDREEICIRDGEDREDEVGGWDHANDIEDADGG